jgi:integrase
MKLGPHGPLSAEAARKKAMAVLARVADGFDPSAERWVETPTVRDLAERYLREHAATKKKPSSAKSDAQNLRLHVLPALGDLPVTEVTQARVEALHHRMSATPGAANRVLALLSKMLNLAERWGLRPMSTNPCRHVDRYPERKLERFLSTEELVRLGDTLRELEAKALEPRPVLAAIRFLTLTGARRGEVLNLCWEDVDFERARLRIRDSKTGPKCMPLSAPALQVLRTLPRTSEWVFPTAAGGGALSLSNPWDRIRRRAGLENVRIHDLRHSFASVGAGAGLGLPIIGRLLGHTQATTTSRYAHLADDPVRHATELIGREISRSLGTIAPACTAASDPNARPRP